MVDGWDKMDANKDVLKNGWIHGMDWEKWKGKKKINMFRNRKRRGKGKGIRRER